MNQQTSINVLTVTPQMAAIWLNRNDCNRSISKNHLDSIVYAIESGQWVFNGDPIRFNGSGNLIDGQHRLAAIVKTNKPQEMLVVQGLESNAQMTIDINRKRSPADQLKILGIKNYYLCASVAARYVLYKRGYSIPTCIQRSMALTIADIVHTAVKYEEQIQHSINTAKYAIKITNSTLAVFLHMVFGDIDLLSADSFFDLFNTQHYPYEHHPVAKLKQRLYQNKITATHKLPRNMVAALYIKTWNAFLFGDTIKSLSWRPNANEPYPKIHGRVAE